MGKRRTLAQQILDAKAEVAAWPPGLRESVQLQGPVDHFEERQDELARLNNERTAAPSPDAQVKHDDASGTTK